MDVTVIDTELSNIDSICRALELCGASVRIATRAEHVRNSNRLVLPGVGAFPAVMENLRMRGLAVEILEHVRSERPFLGICLGMQIMAGHSEEMGGARGLGVIAGNNVPLQPAAKDERVPHIGWSGVHDNGDPLFAGIPAGTDFYFVHSYHMVCENPDNRIAQTLSHGGFTAAVRQGMAYGVQFHPEKSQKAGFALLGNFLAM